MNNPDSYELQARELKMLELVRNHNLLSKHFLEQASKTTLAAVNEIKVTLGENPRLISVSDPHSYHNQGEAFLIKSANIDPSTPECWSVTGTKDEKCFTFTREADGRLVVRDANHYAVEYSADSDMAQSIFNQVGIQQRSFDSMEPLGMAAALVDQNPELSRRDVIKATVTSIILSSASCLLAGCGVKTAEVTTNGKAVPTEIAPTSTPTPEKRAENIAKKELATLLSKHKEKINEISVMFLDPNDFIAYSKQDGIAIPEGHENQYLEESDAKFLTRQRIVIINKEASTFTTRLGNFKSVVEKENFLTSLFAHVIKHELTHSLSTSEPVTQELKDVVNSEPLLDGLSAETTFGYSIGLNDEFQLSGLEEVVVTAFNSLNCGSTCTIEDLMKPYVSQEMKDLVDNFLSATFNLSGGSFTYYVEHKADHGITGLIESLVSRYSDHPEIPRVKIVKMVFDFVLATTFAHTSYLYYRALDDYLKDNPRDEKYLEYSRQYRSVYSECLRVMKEISDAVNNRTTAYPDLYLRK